MEVWSGSRVVRETQVPKDLHGKVYNDNWFGTGASWNADETRIAYVAEVSALSAACPHRITSPAGMPWNGRLVYSRGESQSDISIEYATQTGRDHPRAIYSYTLLSSRMLQAPPGVKTPEWGGAQNQAQAGSKNASSKPEGKAPKAGPKGWRGVGEFQVASTLISSACSPTMCHELDVSQRKSGTCTESQEDWGELNTGKKVPQLFVLEVESGDVTTVAGLPEDTSVGQPVWTPDASGALSAGDLI